MVNNMPDSEQKKLHRKKMVAPIIIAVVLALYYIGFFAVCVIVPVPFPINVLMGIVPLVIAGVIIYVLIERIEEIRSGEEDDLSKY